MCIRDSRDSLHALGMGTGTGERSSEAAGARDDRRRRRHDPVSYTHLRAHETVLDLVCRLLLDTKNTLHTRLSSLPPVTQLNRDVYGYSQTRTKNN